MSRTDLVTFLQEKMQERNWSLRKLSDATGISPAHLEHLLHGEFDELPAAPYLHGYLTKLGAALDFDPEPWWRAIRASAAGTILPRSGVGDTLPTNRFSRARTGHWAWLGIIVLALLIYGGMRFAAIFGLPTLTVLVPETDTISTTTQNVTLRGTLTNGTDLTVNGEAIPLAPDNSWQKNVTLSTGINTFEFRAEKFLGRSRTVVRQIVYTPAATSTPDGNATTSTSTATSTAPDGEDEGTTTIIF